MDDQVPQSPIMQIDYGTMPVVDRATMSAQFRICTPALDRQGDIIEPSGVTWEEYRFAPSVKYEHGFSGVPYPIARSADDSGLLHMSYGNPNEDGEQEDAIYARAFFSPNFELQTQMFALIEEGFLRAASIHVLPIAGFFKALANNRKHAFRSTVLEWSICTVAMNGESYAKALVADSQFSEVLNLQLDAANRILSRGTLDGRLIIPSIAKCLVSVKPPPQPALHGFNPKDESMTKIIFSQAQVQAMKPIALAKAVANPTAYDADTLKLLRAMAKSLPDDGTEYESLPKTETLPDTELPSEEPPVDPTVVESVEESSELEPGAAFLTSIHSAVNDLVAKLDAANKATEKPEVLEFVAQFAESLRAELLSCEGAYSGIYPDAPTLAAAAAEPVDGEMIKSWIADRSTRSFQLEGLATRLAKSIGDPAKLQVVALATTRDLRLPQFTGQGMEAEGRRSILQRSNSRTI